MLSAWWCSSHSGADQWSGPAGTGWNNFPTQRPHGQPSKRWEERQYFADCYERKTRQSSDDRLQKMFFPIFFTICYRLFWFCRMSKKFWLSFSGPGSREAGVAILMCRHRNIVSHFSIFLLPSPSVGLRLILCWTEQIILKTIKWTIWATLAFYSHCQRPPHFTAIKSFLQIS